MMCVRTGVYLAPVFLQVYITIFYKKVIVEGFLIALLYLKETDIETLCKTIKHVNLYTVVNFNSM